VFSTPFSAFSRRSGSQRPGTYSRSENIVARLILAPERDASPRAATTRARLQRLSMGGTGLEPVTPSLSRRPPRSRLLAGSSDFSLPYRDFALQRQDAFAPVCTLSRGLVIARGSTVGASPTATANNDEHHGKRQYSRLAGGAHPRRGARASSGMRSPQARANSRSRLPSSRATRTLLCPTLGLCCTCLPRSSRGHVVCFSGRAVAQVTFPHHCPRDGCL